MNQKKKNNIIIGALCGVLLLMVVGYAAFQSVLKINGTTNISSSWNILITDIQTKNIVGGATNASEPTGKGTLTATFNTNLVSPGDSLEYDITVTNSGTVDAKLDKINLSDSKNPAIIFTTSGLKEGSLLSANGGTATLTVKVEYSNSVTSQPDSTTSNLTVTLDYVQDDGTAVAPGGDTFTGTIYRKNTGNYLVNGKAINETTTVYYPSADYSSVEEALADGYFYVNEADCVANVTTCASGPVTLSTGDYVDNPSSLGKFYLKHVIENDVVMESYVCFVTDEEHCMQGGSPSYYAANKTLLQGQQTWFTNNGGSCNFDDSYSYCNGGGFSFVNAYSYGIVFASADAEECSVPAVGLSYCN